MRLFLMGIGWFAGGLVLSVRLVFIKVDPPCPKISYKCWIGSLISVAYGLGYYFLMGMKGGFAGFDYLTSFIVASVVGAAVARILCPLP